MTKQAGVEIKIQFLKTCLFYGLLVVFSPILHSTVQAQSYPSKPVHLIVPFPPGGGTDGVARSIGSGLSAALQQPVVIENRPGAGGLVAWSQVSRASPDGYTLAMVANNIRLYPLMGMKLDFDPEKDLVPVASVASVPMVLAGSKSNAASSLSQLISIGKESPGRLNFGHPGTGGPHHLAYTLFLAETGIRFTLVPYKGTGPLMNDLAGGQIDVAFIPLSAAQPHFSSETGRLRNYGLAAPKRSPLAPQLPTMSENGGPAFDASYWFAIAAPKGTPQQIIDQLSTQINNLLATQTIQESLSKQGFEPRPGSSEETRDALANEVRKWGPLIKAHGIRID